MAGKRKERDDDAGSSIREDLGFDSERAYRRWKRRPRFKPFWDAFEAGFLKSDAFQPGKEYEEFDHIHEHINLGDSGLNRRYSGRGVENHFTTSIHWLSWIVFHIAYENTMTFDGCFARTRLSLYEVRRRIWNTIQYEIQSRSSASESVGKRRKRNSGSDFLDLGEGGQADLFSDSPNDDEDESDSDDDLDPSAGVAHVHWTNIPDHACFSERRAMVRITGFCGLSETEFETQVYKALGFEENLEQIRTLTCPGYSFRECKWRASFNFTMRFEVETECVCP
jgi:hypothetical protein